MKEYSSSHQHKAPQNANLELWFRVFFTGFHPAEKAKGRPISWTQTIKPASMQSPGPGKSKATSVGSTDAQSWEKKKGIGQISEKNMSASCLSIRRESWGRQILLLNVPIHWCGLWGPEFSRQKKAIHRQWQTSQENCEIPRSTTMVEASFFHGPQGPWVSSSTDQDAPRVLGISECHLYWRCVSRWVFFQPL